MAISQAKRDANNRWDKENMQLVACKIRKEDALLFNEYGIDKNTIFNALLREFIYKCINKNTNDKSIIEITQNE